jgi:hypothetical protein
MFIAKNVLKNIKGEKVAWGMVNSKGANPNNSDNIPRGSSNMNFAHSELSKAKDQREYEKVQHGRARYVRIPQHVHMQEITSP